MLRSVLLLVFVVGVARCVVLVLSLAVLSALLFVCFVVGDF